MIQGSSLPEAFNPMLILANDFQQCFLPIKQQLHLQRSLVLYRMVFDQHHQEDVVKYLLKRFNEEQIADLVEIQIHYGKLAMCYTIRRGC